MSGQILCDSNESTPKVIHGFFKNFKFSKVLLTSTLFRLINGDKSFVKIPLIDKNFSDCSE